jgi:2-dehydropantoate 2-reductase
MKIIVVGAGAIGSVVGGLLAKSGEDVTLIARKPHVYAIRHKGLMLDGPFGRKVIEVKAAESLDFKPDLVLLTVKTQDVESSINEIKPFISDVPVVTMQNGVRSDDIVAGILGKENIISCVVVLGSIFLESGKVSYSNPSGKTALLIGDPFSLNSNRLQIISVLLNNALPTEISGDIRGAHWTKLIMNLNNAVMAVTGLPMQECSQYPQIRKLNINLMKEGFKVMKQAGIKLAPVPGIPLSLMKIMVWIPLPISSFVLKSRIKSYSKLPVLGSTLQSIKRGKNTEIDYLNGEIVKLGKKNGIPTPANSLIVELVHQTETTGKFLTVDELTKQLG